VLWPNADYVYWLAHGLWDFRPACDADHTPAVSCVLAQLYGNHYVHQHGEGQEMVESGFALRNGYTNAEVPNNSATGNLQVKFRGYWVNSTTGEKLRL